ncbi:macrophage mannose receptor 1-like [Pectinophora gossypiella]|uniref:macrophage mannose receptor 1-like n=1 Tax=Pectinophora gossypiella TaxID=13191 RepID=UPI00214EFF61|nr:macrophage mannose receptor 1-like [Pectinophora gossypiella]
MYRWVIILHCVAVIHARHFRSDYTYYHELNGWMKLHQMPTTWDDARQRCTLEGSVLASPVNNELLQAMKIVIGQSRAKRGVFTGVSDIFSPGDFFSVEGIPIGKISADWAPSEPDNKKNEEHCIAMLPNGTIADVNCNEPYPYICFKQNTPNMPTPYHCGTVDPEYKLESRTGSCYKFHRIGRPWPGAFKTCVAEGGHLAIINSDTEAQVLKEMYAKNPDNIVKAKYPHVASIGFNKWGETSSYSWLTIHGQTLQEAGYEVWEPNTPNNATPGEYCGSIYRSGKLNDMRCHEAIPFFCEKLPGSLIENEQDSVTDINSN